MEDDPAVRELVSLALDLDGHEVIATGDLAGARTALDDTPVDAVLLDRTLPDGDGRDLLRELRADPDLALVPVLLVTGHDEVADRVEGLDLGADDYVVKPFEPDEVAARVRSHLRGHRAWVERLTAVVDERRGALAAAARDAGAAEDAAGAAAAICASLVGLGPVRGTALLSLAAGDVAVLAAAGQPLPDEVVATGGLEPGAAGLGGPIDRVVPGGRVVGGAIRAGGADLGVLLAVGDPAAGGQLLADVLDFADLAAGVLAEQLRSGAARGTATARVRALMAEGASRPVYQPVIAVDGDRVVGWEALTRFAGGVDPERTFVEAARLGLGHDLEVATLSAAVAGAGSLDGAWLALNVTPSLVLETHLLGPILAAAPADQVVLEISELEPVRDYDALLAAVDELGVDVQLSVDDAGSGFASLAHILALGARFVKLDKTWVRGLPDDPAKRALVAGLRDFAAETGASLVAEGVETAEELAACRGLGIEHVQGWFVGRPVDSPDPGAAAGT